MYVIIISLRGGLDSILSPTGPVLQPGVSVKKMTNLEGAVSLL